jgi:hypothetical protein
MKIYRLIHYLLYLLIIVLFVKCEIDKSTDNKEEFNFPEIDYIDRYITTASNQPTSLKRCFPASCRSTRPL